MAIRIRAYGEYEEFEALRPEGETTDWTLLISGHWSDSPAHSGHVTYNLGKTEAGAWLLERVQRDDCLDDVTEEDIEEGALNDDQLQALWRRERVEARGALEAEQREIVGAWSDALKDATVAAVAKAMLQAVGAADGIVIDEPDMMGMFECWPDPMHTE